MDRDAGVVPGSESGTDVRTQTFRARAEMYVEDILGVCWVWDLERDIGQTLRLCVQLLGDTAVADIKTEFGTRWVIIGWVLHLDEQLVAVARRKV